MLTHSVTRKDRRNMLWIGALLFLAQLVLFVYGMYTNYVNWVAGIGMIICAIAFHRNYQIEPIDDIVIEWSDERYK